MKITVEREDGIVIQSVAHKSFRSGPKGNWMVGDVNINDWLDAVHSRNVIDLSGFSAEQVLSYVKSSDEDLTRKK